MSARIRRDALAGVRSATPPTGCSSGDASFDANLEPHLRAADERSCARSALAGLRDHDGARRRPLGNRIAAAAIAAGRHDGSNESLHYADPSYVPRNQPLIVARARLDGRGRDVLAAARARRDRAAGRRRRARRSAELRRRRVGRRAHVRARGGDAPRRAAAARRSRPGSAYKQAALAVIRATAEHAHAARDDVAARLEPHRARRAPATSPRTSASTSTLNGALNDAAVVAWRAKRAYQAPRPISMIRYLAFSGQSSDPKQPSYSTDGLPLVAGLASSSTARSRCCRAGAGSTARVVAARRRRRPRRAGSSEGERVRLRRRRVLTALTGRSFARRGAARRAPPRSRTGSTSRPDVAAGRALGERVARARARARAER